MEGNTKRTRIDTLIRNKTSKRDFLTLLGNKGMMIVINMILSHLPPLSLLNASQVSKSWCDIVKTSKWYPSNFTKAIKTYCSLNNIPWRFTYEEPKLKWERIFIPSDHDVSVAITRGNALIILFTHNYMAEYSLSSMVSEKYQITVNYKVPYILPRTVIIKANDTYVVMLAGRNNDVKILTWSRIDGEIYKMFRCHLDDWLSVTEFNYILTFGYPNINDLNNGKLDIIKLDTAETICSLSILTDGILNFQYELIKNVFVCTKSDTELSLYVIEDCSIPTLSQTINLRYPTSGYIRMDYPFLLVDDKDEKGVQIYDLYSKEMLHWIAKDKYILKLSHGIIYALDHDDESAGISCMTIRDMFLMTKSEILKCAQRKDHGYILYPIQQGTGYLWANGTSRQRKVHLSILCAWNHYDVAVYSTIPSLFDQSISAYKLLVEENVENSVSWPYSTQAFCEWSP